MRASFKKASDRFQQTYSGKAFFGESNVICPLYQVLEHVCIDLSNTEDYWKICDLQHIVHSLVNVTKVGDTNLSSDVGEACHPTALDAVARSSFRTIMIGSLTIDLVSQMQNVLKQITFHHMPCR
jgi:hypothetical protein